MLLHLNNGEPKLGSGSVSRQERLHPFGVLLEIGRAAEGDEYREHTLCGESDHGALGIARGAAVRTKLIREKRQTLQIQIVFSNAFVGFSRAARAKRDVASDVREIV